MPVDKLAPQMQLNCIIAPIDFVLDFKMYRHLMASLSKEALKAKALQFPENKEKHYQMIRENHSSPNEALLCL